MSFSALPTLCPQNGASYNKADKTASRPCNWSKKIQKFWEDFVRGKTLDTTNERRRNRHPPISKNLRAPISRNLRAPISKKLRAQCSKTRRERLLEARTLFRAVRQTNRSLLIHFQIGRRKSRKKLDWSWGFTRPNKKELDRCAEGIWMTVMRLVHHSDDEYFYQRIGVGHRIQYWK